MKIIRQIMPLEPLIQSKLKVAAYARVSTASDRMHHSLSAQISHYNQVIQNNPNWEFAGIYADYGTTGTSIKKRPEFQRLLEECEKGKIDIILTKSIQRFARNTVDLLETIRHLKDLGIEVRFEKENISSLSNDGEVMLSILASFAQEESRSISQNVKWGTVKRFKQGIPNGQFQIFGYEWINSRLEIVPEEAKIIQLMVDMYLSGQSVTKIYQRLNKEGYTTRKGFPWIDSNVRKILFNITYTGNLLLQKEYVVDPITQKKKINRGELPQYFAEETHDAIIPMPIYQQILAEKERRLALGVFYGNKNTSELTQKIICHYCQKSFQRCSRKRVDGRFYAWRCATRREGKQGNPCHTKDLPEAVIQSLICQVVDIEAYQTAVAQIEQVEVFGKDKLMFHLTDGTIETRPFPTRKDIKEVLNGQTSHNHSSED